MLPFDISYVFKLTCACLLLLIFLSSAFFSFFLSFFLLLLTDTFNLFQFYLFINVFFKLKAIVVADTIEFLISYFYII